MCVITSIRCWDRSEWRGAVAYLTHSLGKEQQSRISGWTKRKRKSWIAYRSKWTCTSTYAPFTDAGFPSNPPHRHGPEVAVPAPSIAHQPATHLTLSQSISLNYGLVRPSSTDLHRFWTLPRVLEEMRLSPRWEALKPQDLGGYEWGSSRFPLLARIVVEWVHAIVKPHIQDDECHSTRASEGKDRQVRHMQITESAIFCDDARMEHGNPICCDYREPLAISFYYTTRLPEIMKKILQQGDKIICA